MLLMGRFEKRHFVNKMLTTELSFRSWTQRHLSTQGRSVKLTLMSARATLVAMEAPASTNQTASPATVHLGG